MTSEEIDKLHDFYEYEVDFEKAKLKSITFDRLSICRKLMELGFYRYDTDDDVSLLVRIHNNKISITKEVFVVDTFEKYIKDLPTRSFTVTSKDESTTREIHITSELLLKKIYKDIKSYIKNNLDRLRPDFEINLLQDEEKKKYFFFSNVAVCVTPARIETIPYEELNGFIWESAIVQRPFNFVEIKGDFEKFIENVTFNEEERKISMMTMLGYLMHDYYECNLFAVIFTDENKSNSLSSAGGTGKGIIGKALSCMLNRTANDIQYLSISGKNIDLFSDKRYMKANINTQLIHIEDIKKNPDFEQLYNDIADDVEIKKHYKEPFKRKIKFMISTNQTISLDGESSKRRARVMELKNHYGKDWTPEDEFGKRFFESKWDEMDWSCFYSFMCMATQLYLQKGVVEAEEKNYQIRTLYTKTSEDFVYYLDEKFNIFGSKKERKYDKKYIYDTFIQLDPTCRWSLKLFNNNIRLYMNTKNIPYEEIREGNNTRMWCLFPTAETRAAALAAKQAATKVLQDEE